MLNKLLITLIITGLTSCNNVFLDSPQPINTENLINIPSELQGEWENDEVKIVIDKTSFKLTELRPDNTTKETYYVISDSVLLRKADQIYVANIKKGEWWEIFLLEINKKNEITGYFLINEGAEKFNKLSLVKSKNDGDNEAGKYYYTSKLNVNQIAELKNRVGEQMFTLLPDSTITTGN